MTEGRLGSQISVEIAQHSDPGRDPNKQVNEDSCGYAHTKFGHLCVLCDGMGGHYGGQEASRRAITTVFEQMEKAPGHLTPASALKMAIEEAARRVYELGGPPDNRVRPGSTIVSMLLHEQGVDVAHVGDSRAYVVRSNQIYPLTRDHSMVQSMIDAGFLTEEQAIGHPDANKITRALGMKPEVDVEVRPEPMELFAGDILLQSSDGLTDLALGHEILAAVRQALNSGNVEYCCQQLVRLANDRGGHDNITVQMARVIKTAPRQTRSGATHVPDAPAGGGASPSPTFSGAAGQPAPGYGLTGTAPAGPNYAALAQQHQQAQQAAPGYGAQAGMPAAAPSGHGHAGYGAGPAMPLGPESVRAGPTVPMQGHAAPSMAHGHSGQMQAAVNHHANQGHLTPPMTPAPAAFGGHSQAFSATAQAMAPYQVDRALQPPPSRAGAHVAPGGAPAPLPAAQPYAVTPTPGPYAGAGPSGGDWDGAVSAPPTTNKNVIFIWMGVAFILASVILVIIWVLFWRQ